MAKFTLSSRELSSGIFIPLLVLVIGIVGYFVVFPKYKEVQTKREALALKEKEVKTHSAQLDGVRNLVSELGNKKKDLSPIDEALPPAPRIPELLANFDYLAKQSGMFLAGLNLTVAPTLAKLEAGQNVTQAKKLEGLLKKTKDLGVMQVNLTVKGEYNNFKAFLLNLEQNMRLMDMQGLIISSPGEKTATREFSIILQTYYQIIKKD